MFRTGYDLRDVAQDEWTVYRIWGEPLDGACAARSGMFYAYAREDLDWWELAITIPQRGPPPHPAPARPTRASAATPSARPPR